MHALTAFGLTTFLLCLVLTPLCRNIAIRLRLFDRPDNDRKLHLKDIPRIGGVPIVLSYAGGLGVMLLIAPHGARISIQHDRMLWALLPAAVIMFLTGLIDDIIQLKPWQKLCGQLVAITYAVLFGARISALHGLPSSHWITIPLSMLWLLGCTNALNLIDGLDGLASGVGILASITVLLAAIFSGDRGLAMATAPLVGCLLAFLRYNFNPASVFLGDCGSLTIGFMLGCFGLIWSQPNGTILGMAAPFMMLALPLVDVGLSITRRFLRSAPIFKGDRGHIHHMILARGFRPRSAALILYGVCTVAAILALLLSFTGIRFHGPILFIFCLLVLIGINYLGYVELHAARQAFSRKSIFRVLKEEIYLHDLKRALAGVESLEDYWQVVSTVCKELRFATVQMHFDDSFQGSFFENGMDASPSDASWRMTLALGKRGRLDLTRTSDDKPPALMIAVLGQLQKSIREREHFLLESADFIRTPAEDSGVERDAFRAVSAGKEAKNARVA